MTLQAVLDLKLDSVIFTFHISFLRFNDNS